MFFQCSIQVNGFAVTLTDFMAMLLNLIATEFAAVIIVKNAKDLGEIQFTE